MQRKESVRKGALPTILIMLLACLATAVISIWVLYQYALEAEKARLVELLQSHTRLINAVANFDALHSTADHPLGSKGATLSQVHDAFVAKSGFGVTGEFVIAQRDQDTIRFLLNSRHLDQMPASIPINSNAAEPMRRALAGESGMLIGLDYRSIMVLAAYEPVPMLNVGLVAKIDMSELRAPYLRAAVIAGTIAIAVIALGLLLINQIEKSARQATRKDDLFHRNSAIHGREWFVYRVLLMAIVSMAVIGVSQWTLYGSFFDSTRQRLIDMVESNAHFINAVAKFDAEFSALDYPGGAIAATLSQVREALNGTHGFGESGEFVLGVYYEYNIVFLTNARALDHPIPPIHITADDAVPMQQALAGRSGSLIGLDYSATEVLAAHEPVPRLKAGLVAKIDLRELRAPFMKAAVAAITGAIIAILLASVLIWRRGTQVRTALSPLGAVALNSAARATQSIEPELLVLTIGLGGLILALDLALPLGVVGGVLYVLFILTGKWFPKRQHIIALAFVASVLTIAGYLLSPAGGVEWMALANRALTLFAIWVTALIVSAAKGTEIALDAQAAALQTLSLSVEHNPSSIMITDPEGMIEYTNLKFSEMSGFDRGEVLGKNPSILQSTITPLADYQNLWGAITVGKEWRGKLQNQKPSGQLYWVSTAILPIKSAAGETLHFVALQEDITERLALEKKMKYQATHDSLTGLPTRKLLIDRLSTAMAVARRNKSKAAVLFLDLDGFKEVNDTLGHDGGDYVLAQTAVRLSRCLREVDTVARIGGDEFLIVLTDMNDKASISNVANKVIKYLAKPYKLGREEANIGVSIGISLYPDHGLDPETLLKSADQAMYEIKRRGKK